MKSSLFLLIASSLLTFNALGQKKTTPILVTDLLKIKKAGSVQINPNGNNVVFTVNSILPDPKSKDDYIYQTQIWSFDSKGKTAAVPITHGKESASQPLFSPDGRNILFTKNVKGKSQLFLIKVGDTATTQFTDFRYGASSAVWSPDGKRIAFTASIPLLAYIKDDSLNPKHLLPNWPDEKPGISGNADLKINNEKADPDGNPDAIRAYLSKNELDKKAKVFSKVQYQTETATTSEILLSHVFIVELSNPKQIRAVTSGFNSFTKPVFTDSHTLLLNGKIDDSKHPDDLLDGQIYRINTDGSGLKLLLGEKDKSFSIAAVSNDGHYLAYQTNIPGTVNVPLLWIRNLKLPEKQDVKVNVDRNTSGEVFNGKDNKLYFTAAANGGFVLYRVATDGTKLEKLSLNDKGITDFDIKGDQLVYAETAVANPSEIYQANQTAKNPVRRSAINVDWLQNKIISFPEKYTYKNELGLAVEYWVVKPINFDATKKYPLLLEMHGGPASMWGPGDISMWHEYQYFAAKGYGIVYGNPRGSSGYGDRFLKSNVNDWGPGPSKDVLSYLDQTVHLGWADTTKLLISGGSYAGYLTAWIISHDQRFLAASAQRGVYNFKTFFGEANVWRMVPRYFEGYLWEEQTAKMLDEQSPINYVANINTPLLIFHGDADNRTGITQSGMLYRSLKVLGKPVEYVQHPGASHELVRTGDNRQRIDQMLRTWEFFNRYLTAKPE